VIPVWSRAYNVSTNNPLVMSSLLIGGPYDGRVSAQATGRQRLFVCQPASRNDETACATKILTTFAKRAYRRQPTKEDVQTLVGFYRAAREKGDFDAGIRAGVERVLVSPDFLFRIESDPAGSAPGTAYNLSDLALASRLSFFLWSSIPDDALRAAAAGGELRDETVLEREILRMLADPKADALVANFASQWLGLRDLDTVSPASAEFDGNLRQSFRKETELLFATVLREDSSVVELLDADYTFVDARLAEHYGLPGIGGSRFRRVALDAASPRRGLLGHGSILTVTSAPNRTSPVKRGQWVLQNVLGTPPPPPPEGVETNLDETAPVGAGPTTMRQRLERHQADPGCAACHNFMDPIGFALENFDFTGRWRDADAGAVVDAHGVFIDGSEIDGPAGLRRALLARDERFVATFTEKLLTYALGRTLEASDMPAVREIVRRAKEDDYRFSTLVLGVANSVPMRMRSKR
jgi:hypothetical protein